MRSFFYANTASRRAAATADGANVAFPELEAGQSWTVALRFLDRVDGTLTEIFPAVAAVRASIGPVDARARSGTLKWQVGAGASTEANTTTAFNHDASPAVIEGYLNGLSGGTADYSVDFDSGSYLIRRATGAQVTITPRDNRMSPVSFARVRYYQEGGGHWVTEVRNVQAPWAFTDSADPKLPQKPFVKTLQDGYTDGSGTWSVNEKQRLTIPEEFRGQFFFRKGLKKTGLLTVADGPDEIKAALDAMLKGEGGSVTVTNADNGVLDIVFRGDLAGVNVAEMTIDVPVEGAPPGDWTFTLDLARGEVWAGLRLQNPATLRFVVEVDVWNDPDDHDAGHKTVKLWNEEVTLKFPVTTEEMATPQNIDWQRPSSPRDYRRFGTGSFVPGQQHFISDAFGNGTLTEFEFDHNLGTEAISGLEVLNVETGAFLVRGTDYTVPESTADTVTLEMTEAPALNSLRLILTTAGPVSAFIDGLEIEIDQVTGLQALLDDYNERIGVVEGALAVSGVGASATIGWSSSIILPAYGELFPAALMVRGKPEFPPLPRAIKDTSTTAIAAEELPDATSAVGAVYEWGSTTEVYIPGDIYRRGRMVKKADAAAILSDGYHWYLAEEGPADIFYPIEMNRVLWEMVVSPEQLAPGRRLRVNWSFLLALVAERPEMRGTYQLRVRKGVPAAESALGSAPNIEGIIWDNTEGTETPLFEQKLTLTRSGMIHEFACEIVRAANGNLSASKTIYGKTTSATAPAGSNFILRAELSRFDLTNYSEPTGRPVGQVYLLNGNADDEAAGAVKKRFPIQTSDNAPALGLSAIIS